MVKNPLPAIEAERLLDRLDAIGAALNADGRALALLSLGSVGADLARLDSYSDLDFFVIARSGYKAALIGDRGWLQAPASLVYQFANTPDGAKALYEDGVFVEYAVFEADELSGIAFADSRVVWASAEFDRALAVPAERRPGEAPPLEWLIGEALTNLYVGMGRFLRGEKLSAYRFIQQYALDRVIDIVCRNDKPAAGSADPFAPDRRFEQRYPVAAHELAAMIQGYERSPASALAILAFLERRAAVNPALANVIRARCAAASPDRHGPDRSEE